MHHSSRYLVVTHDACVCVNVQTNEWIGVNDTADQKEQGFYCLGESFADKTVTHRFGEYKSLIVCWLYPSCELIV